MTCTGRCMAINGKSINNLMKISNIPFKLSLKYSGLLHLWAQVSKDFGGSFYYYFIINHVNFCSTNEAGSHCCDTAMSAAVLSEWSCCRAHAVRRCSTAARRVNWKRGTRDIRTSVCASEVNLQPYFLLHYSSYLCINHMLCDYSIVSLGALTALRTCWV